MKEEKIHEIGVIFTVDFLNHELTEEDFDPRKYCPEFAWKWIKAEAWEGKRWNYFSAEAVLSVEELHAWLEKMPMSLMKTPSKDSHGDKWVVFKAKTSEAVLEMFCWPFLKKGITSFAAKKRAMMKEFGS